MIAGRQDIIQFFYEAGFLRSNKMTAWRTIQRWVKRRRIILRHDSNNKPFILEAETRAVKIKQSDVINGEKT